jgi:hypothetical protein
MVIQEVYKMTTARERYEAKTRVVTFRVREEEYQQLEELKAETGLSNADLVMLGAGIAQEQRKAKLAEITGLEDRLTRLQQLARQRERELDELIAEARTRRLAELDTEIQAFKLFDLGWGLEQAAFKLGVDGDTAYRYFRNWGEVKGEKEALERELLRACLKECIKADELEYLSYGLSSNPPTERIEALRKEMDYCHYLLTAPDKITPRWRAFLLTKYSSRILADRSEKSPGA